MTGWHLPSKDEAQIIRSSVLPRLDTFNSDISSLGGTPLSGTVRYLCASFEFTYAFKEKTTVSKAGQKTKYSIRLVKDTVISHNISVNF
jgi:transposase-like protein